MASSTQLSHNTATIRRAIAPLVMTMIVAFGMDRCTEAQSLWEVTPYRILIWLSLESSPEVPVAWGESLPRRILEQTDASVPAAWRVTVEPAPKQHRRSLLSGAVIDAFELLSANTKLSETDKVVLLTVRTGEGGYALSATELDVQTRVWSRPINRIARVPSAIPVAAFELLCHVFVPVAQITRVEGTRVTAEYRAAALTYPATSIRAWQDPTRVTTGDILLPYIRKRDRNNRVTETGVTAVDYTVLFVQEMAADSNRSDEAQPAGLSLNCEAYSGYRQPFRTRRSSRVQQLALVGRELDKATTLRIHNRDDKDKPLEGYEIYARAPGSEKSEFVGRTDRQGMVSIPKSDTAVRLLFIKSGTRVLAKLPIVPGLQSQVDVPLRDDQSRLEAEGFLIGIQESLVDLVARREILTVRIRANIDDKKFELAETLIDELRRLPSREDFEATVQQRKRSLSTSDASVQHKIDQLFADTRELFSRYLDPRQAQVLRDELDAARGKRDS